MGIIYEESSLLQLPISDLLDTCENIIKNGDDESLRGEAIWVLGKTANRLNNDDSNREKIAEMLEYVLKFDDNDIVKHEACFQLGEHKFFSKIDTLVNSALNDPSEIVRHEAVEAFGLMQAFNHRDVIRKALEDENSGVRQTASFVLKQLDRLEKIHSLK